MVKSLRMWVLIFIIIVNKQCFLLVVALQSFPMKYIFGEVIILGLDWVSCHGYLPQIWFWCWASRGWSGERRAREKAQLRSADRWLHSADCNVALFALFASARAALRVSALRVSTSLTARSSGQGKSSSTWCSKGWHQLRSWELESLRSYEAGSSKCLASRHFLPQRGLRSTLSLMGMTPEATECFGHTQNPDRIDF